MGKGAPSTTTQTTKSEPWSAAQPHLSNVMGEAQRLYQSGVGQQFYPGSTVVPFSPQTESGLTMLENQAAQGAPLYDQALGSAQGIMQGFNPALAGSLGVGYGGRSNPWESAVAGAGQSSALSATAPMIGAGTGANPYVQPLAVSGFAANPYAQQLASSQANPYASRFASSPNNPYASDIIYAGGRGTQGPGMDQLSASASGAWMGGNPLLADQFQQGADLIQNRVGGVFNNSGMYNSAAHQNALQQGLGDLWTNLASNSYNTERQLMQSAAGQQAALSGADAARALQSAGMASDVWGQDAARALQGAGMGADIWNQDAARALQGAGMASDVWGQDAARRMAGLEGAAGLQEAGYGRGLSAADLWGNLASSDANRSLSGYQGAADIFNADTTAQLSGLGQANDIWGQSNAQAMLAASQLPALYQYGSLPAQQLMQAGSAREDLASLYLNDQMQRFNFGQQAPFTALDRYLSAVGGFPSGLGTQGTTQTAQRASNPLMGAIGGAAGGAGIASTIAGGLGTAGAANFWNPWGWALMGGGALLGAMQ